MGLSTSKTLQPEQLAMFKKLPASNNVYQPDIKIPELAENRVPTDRKFLIVFGVMIILLLPFLIYTLAYSDIDRYSVYDQCGNICGKNNVKYDQWDCSGKDHTDNKMVQFESSYINPEIALNPRECVSECSYGYQEIITGVCVKSERSSTSTVTDVELQKSGQEIAEFLNNMTWRIVLACFLSLGVALSMLYLFRVATAAMVWSILAGVIAFLAILVGFLWYGYTQFEEKGGFIVLPLFFTVVLAILLAVIIFLHKKIALVIAIFKEAMKATFAMPRLLLIPILMFLVELIVFVLFITALAYMFSAGVLTEVQEGFLVYLPNIVMRFSVIFCFWMTFWVCQFLVGIQYMVIAGAVAKWFFAPDKNNLDGPILTSAHVAFKYHLGSIAFGSMIITIMAIVRSLLSSLFKNRILKACFEACVSVIEDFLRYLSKNSYIMTAMHGKPFFKSGKRAAQILLQNVVSIAVLNYIGDFVIFMAHLLVVLISMLFTYLIMRNVDSPYEWCVYLIVALVSLAVAGICFSIFETVIDTIYLCFCEDKLLNDGLSRPYAMSRDLMEFMENSKKVFGGKK